jgi:hypothetical protein
MSNPSSPNFKPGVGRLVTDRYDFENHIQGNNFRHTANQIDMSPPVMVDGHIKHTVQEAVQAISYLVSPPVLPDASPTVKGLIKLGGDLGGTADIQKVIGIQGNPVNTSTPGVGNVLTWDGFSWSPLAPVNNFTAGGDLIGTNSVQQIVQITGDLAGAGSVTVLCSNIKFNPRFITPLITQADAVGSGFPPAHNVSGVDFTIKAQTGLGIGSGGNLWLKGGEPGALGRKRGGVILSLSNSESPALQLIQPDTSSGRIVSLCASSLITNTNMPAGTGDLVMFIADAASMPTTGTPVGGAILYSNSGKLNIKQSDGNNFTIGSIPNPSTWGESKEYVYSYRAHGLSASCDTPITHSFTVPSNSTTRVDAILVGKLVGQADSYTANVSATFYWNGSAVQVFPGGVNIVNESESIHGTFLFGAPTIISSGNTITVKSGYTNGGSYPNVNWIMVIQAVCIADA